MNSADPALFHLLQLSSPMLPVGAYSYSQGLEWAVDQGMVHDRETAQRWIEEVLRLNISRCDAPILLRMHHAWTDRDAARLTHWNEVFLVSREGSELRAETEQMGYSMRHLLQELAAVDTTMLDILHHLQPLCFPVAFSCAAVSWNIPPRAAASAFLWSWVESQVSVAMKIIPIGQVAGQHILTGMARLFPNIINEIVVLKDDEINTWNPMFAIACCAHETLYSRLFRS